MTRRMARPAMGALVALAVMTLLASAAGAQQAATAEITQLTKPVEVMRRGQTTWTAATTGMRLGDGDQIRALAGGSAELGLPDRSTILISENTRFAVTRLEHDPQTGARTSAFHLIVGKVRADVTRASVQLVRTRQSNFTISTPLGVAGVRGTRMVVSYAPPAGAPPGGQPPGAGAAPAVQQAQAPGTVPPTGGAPATATGEQVLLICLPSPGQDPYAAQCLYYDAVTKTTLLLVGNQFVLHDPTQPLGTPISVSALPPGLAALLAFVNPQTMNHPLLFDPGVTVPTWSQTLILIRGMPFGGQAAIIPPSFLVGGPTNGQLPHTSTVGRDLAVGPDQQTCATPNCPRN